MAWYPGAEHRPLGTQTEPRMTAHNILCFHTMVGSLAGTDNMFDDDGYYGTESHFGVGGSSDGNRDGHVIQWQDTAYGADANLEGKGEVISIETSDGGDPSRPWSPKQLDELVELGIWVCQEYDIPPVLIPDTKPGRRGIGYHRQGCDHSSSYRPRGWPYDAWRVSGGRRWSRALGKTCPGDERIRQLVDIVIPRIQAGLGQEDDMPDRQEFEFWVKNGVLKALMDDNVRAWVERAVWIDRKVYRDGKHIPAIQELADAKTEALATRGMVAGLEEAHRQDQAGEDRDLEAVAAAAERGTRKALTEGTVTVDIDVTGPEGQNT